MIVRVYNFLSEEKPKFSQNLVGIVSDVTNFKYTRRAYDIGSFEMTIPTHADETECIQPDRMLIVGEKIKQTYIDGDPTKRIVVGTFLYVTDVEKKDDTITVTGYDLKYLFALRVTLFPKEEQDKGTYGYYVTSGTTFSCISDIINYNIVNTTDSDRQIYGMFGITMPVNQINADPPLTGIQDDRYMTRLEPVSTAIFNLLKNCKTHFYDMRLIIDDNAEDGDSYNPHMESSEDKPTIIIDESRYNIKSYTRKDGTSAYKNAIYAVVGSGDAVTVKCVKRPDDAASGVKRKEVVLDVDTDSVSEIDRYALKAAEEYVISDDFEIEPLFMDDEAEPELAQKVSIRIDGIEYNTVITEITDEYANGKHSQSYVCGDKKLKVLNVLNKATAGNTQKIVNNKIATGNKPTGVGMYTDEAKSSEVFNDYGRNTAYGNYSHVEGHKNNLKSEGAAWSWATHIEGQENTEASRTSCPSDKKASNNHIEGKLNSSYGRINHVEGVNCFAEYDTQCCHVEGSNSRVSEGAKVAHAEGKDCVAGGNCTHAQNLGTIAEKDNCTALGKYNKDFDYAVMIGGGSSDTDRKNILTVEWDGTVRNTGSVYTDGDVMGKNGVFDGNLSVLGNVNFYGKTNFKVPIATRNAVGGIKIGNNLSIAADGTLSAEAQPDIASASKAGIVKVGENIDVTADGTISIPAPCTLRIDNKASANLVHKYVPVTTSEEKIYYGDISNSIVCNGYTFWGSGMTIADPGVFLDFSPTLMVEKFAKTASGEIIEDCDFQVALVNVDSKAFKSYRLESKKAELTTTSVYKNYSVQFDPIILPTWKSIISPTNNHPYGRLQVTLSLMYVNSSNKVATGNSISGYIDFATEAEYNAAVCLTHSSVRTTRMEERTNAFIIPSSISLVTDTLPETGEEDVLYLIYDEDTAPAMKEYLWHNGAWRYLGTTDVDLSEYLKSTDISAWAKAATKPTYTAKEVGAATAADITAAINAVSIGGRNIVTGTADVVIGYGGHSKGHWRKYGAAGTIQTVDITNTPISCVSKGIRLTSTDENSQIICGQDDIPLNSGVIYTFSCRIRSNSAEGVPCRLQPFYKSTTDHSGNTQDIIISDEWQYISFTAKFSPQSAGTYSGARIYLQPTAAGNYIEVCAMKLEAGNKPTDWSPAPEDAERRITSLEARVAALEAAAVSGGEV
jgi:hypothetical protein